MFQRYNGLFRLLALAVTAPLLFGALVSCSNLNGVNVNTGVNLPGGIRVGANKNLGQGGEQTPTNKNKKVDNNVKLYVFDCGRFATQDISSFGLSNDDTDVRELFVPCYLIEHPTKGRLLWDAGLPAAVAGKGVQPAGNGATQEYSEGLIDQLSDMDVGPEDIDYVAFSHMHFDHVGSANLFSDSTLLIQESEYQAAFKDYADNPIFNYELYKDLAGSTKTLLSGDHDVFGDGKVKIISAPGHTPGHQVLYVYLNNYGPVLLSGDLYHFEASRKLRTVPLFNTNKEQTLESMDKVEKFLKSTSATLWIEHNLAQAERLNLAPDFYD